jgi:hypothetical protein
MWRHYEPIALTHSTDLDEAQMHEALQLTAAPRSVTPQMIMTCLRQSRRVRIRMHVCKNTKLTP